MTERLAGDQSLQLLGNWASPYVMRPRVALNLKGVGYEFLEEVPGTKSELLITSNPVYKKIPVLIHNGKSICESMIIVQYIDEVWTAREHSILPSDPYDRAIARFWAAYVDNELVPSLMKISRRNIGDGEKAEASAEVIDQLRLLEAAFEGCSRGEDFFGGHTIGYVDIALGCLLGWLKAVEKMVGVKLLDKEKIPLLVGWAARFCSADAVKQVMLEFDKMLEARQNTAAATN